MEKFENVKLDEVRFAEMIYVDGTQTIKVTYFNNEYVNIPYDLDHLQVLNQYANANRIMKKAKEASNKIMQEINKDRKEVVPVPGTERVYIDPTSGLNDAEYADATLGMQAGIEAAKEASIDGRDYGSNEEKEDKGYGKAALVGAGIGAAALVGLGAYAGYNAYQNNKANENTNNNEVTADANINDIVSIDEVTYEETVNDIRNNTADLKGKGYMNEDRNLVVTQDMINTTYFLINSSEMSTDTASLIVGNHIISNDMDDVVTDVRNMLEVSAVEDPAYAKGDSDQYFDLSMFFKDEDALKMYQSYVGTLDAIRRLDTLPEAEREAAVKAIYEDVYSYSIDNNSKTFGNPKSVGVGARYVMNVLIRKNVLGTLVEMGYLTEQDYTAITGKHLENGVEQLNTEIMKTNDLWDLLNRLCATETYGGLTAEEVAEYRAEYANQTAPGGRSLS